MWLPEGTYSWTSPWVCKSLLWRCHDSKISLPSSLPWTNFSSWSYARTWTMRHEAKLNMLKLASRLGNFKNIAMSLAFRHQRLLCYELSTGRLLDTPIEAGPCSKPTSEDSEPQHVQESLKAIIPGLNGEASLCQHTWVKKDGLNFKQSNCYVIITTKHMSSTLPNTGWSPSLWHLCPIDWLGPYFTWTIER